LHVNWPQLLAICISDIEVFLIKSCGRNLLHCLCLSY